MPTSTLLRRFLIRAFNTPTTFQRSLYAATAVSLEPHLVDLINYQSRCFFDPGFLSLMHGKIAWFHTFVSFLAATMRSEIDLVIWTGSGPSRATVIGSHTRLADSSTEKEVPPIRSFPLLEHFEDSPPAQYCCFVRESASLAAGWFISVDHARCHTVKINQCLSDRLAFH